MGTTSAYAENTAPNTNNLYRPRNYLRVRGEYAKALKEMGINAELPPRTRRILNDFLLLIRHKGTTSAYAENTQRVGCGH